jgi:shikimate kinase
MAQAFDRPIVLVGMMATGKSHVGRKLAQALNLEFIDTDKLIEQEAGMTIAGIFEAYGEQDFREREAKMILNTLAKDTGARVISTGGGAILRAESADLIFKNTFSIWTQASLPTILERTAKRTDRPLLKNADPMATLQNIASLRYPIYARADMAIDTDSGNVDSIVGEIITAITQKFSL